jgi:hypothetical protein
MHCAGFRVPGSVFVFLCAFGLGVHAFQVQSSGPELRFEVVSVRENTGSDLSIRFEPQPPDGYRETVLEESIGNEDGHRVSRADGVVRDETGITGVLVVDNIERPSPD